MFSGSSLPADVNECDTPGSCSQICNNTKGSFKCSCLSGYSLDPQYRGFCKALGRSTWSLAICSSTEKMSHSFRTFVFSQLEFSVMQPND